MDQHQALFGVPKLGHAGALLGLAFLHLLLVVVGV
jgi:hypothetical protein